jgi:hypothetical protein
MRRHGRDIIIVSACLIAVCGVAAPWTAWGADPTPDLDRHARAVDQAAEAQGQMQVAGRLADQLNASWGQTPGPYTAASLADQRARNGWGWGEVLIGNLLAQSIARNLMAANPTLTPAQALALATDQVTAARQAGAGWGVISKEAGVKLGKLVSGVQKSAAAVSAGEKSPGAVKATAKGTKESGAKAADEAQERAAGVGRGLTGFATEGQPTGGVAVAGPGLAGGGLGRGADRGGQDHGGADRGGGAGGAGGGGGGKGK